MGDLALGGGGAPRRGRAGRAPPLRWEVLTGGGRSSPPHVQPAPSPRTAVVKTGQGAGPVNAIWRLCLGVWAPLRRAAVVCFAAKASKIGAKTSVPLRDEPSGPLWFSPGTWIAH